MGSKNSKFKKKEDKKEKIENAKKNIKTRNEYLDDWCFPEDKRVDVEKGIAKIEESTKKTLNIKTENENLDDKSLIKETISDSFSKYWNDNSFTVFTSVYNMILLIYGNKNNSIICYNLSDNKKVIEIKNVHSGYIDCFRHYLDEINFRDLVISSSSDDNCLKLWNINTFECLLNLEKINKGGYLNCTCFLKDNNKIYIVTSNDNNSNSEQIECLKIFDLKGKKIKEIKNSNDNTYFIDNFYDNKLNYYIITGNNGFSKSYNYKTCKLYQKYKDGLNREYNMSILIQKTKEGINLIDSSCDGKIRIWNFHSAELLNKIDCSPINRYDSKLALYGMYLWNNNYILVGCSDKTIKIIELKSKKVIKSLIIHDGIVLTIRKLNHPKYGECFISQNADYGMKIWSIKFNFF